MISNTSNTAYFTSAGSASFVVGYPFFNKSDLVVITCDPVTQAQTTRAINTDYTITVSGSSPYYSGGTVVFNVAPVSGTPVIVVRQPPLTQAVTYLQNAALPTPTLEQSFDYLTLCCQYLADALGRCIRLQAGEQPNLVNLQIPVNGNRLNKALAFDGFGNLIVQ